MSGPPVGSSLFFRLVKLFWCVSQPPRLTVTNRTPASTSRRAASAPIPSPVVPYWSRVACDSWCRSNAFFVLSDRRMSSAWRWNSSSPSTKSPDGVELLEPLIELPEQIVAAGRARRG